MRQARKQSEPSRELRLRTRMPILGGLACIALVVGGLGAWAVTAPLASAVIAPGVVTVDSKHKKVQHLQGGIVSELRVRDGAIVKAGDTLVRLDVTQARASHAIIRSAYRAGRAEEARLLAERDGLAKIHFPDELREGRSDPEVAAMLRGQRTLFEARRKTLTGQTAILNQRISQLGEEVRGLEAQKEAMEKQLALIHDELKGLQALFKRGHTTRRRILALQREAARLSGERGKLIADIARSKKATGETKLQIIQLKTSFRRDVVGRLREAQTKLVDLRERITAAAQTLTLTDIKAPVGGTVVAMAMHTVGGVIKAGETVLEIVPTQDRLVIEAKVKPVDVDDLAVGQDADVYFTSFNRRTTPSLSGRVVYRSADRLTDERTGQAYYIVRVEISEDEVKRLDGLKLQPGMPAEVMIKTGERTASSYLIRPISDSVRRAWREQ